MKSVKIILLATGIALLAGACKTERCACPGQKKHYKNYRSEALINVELKA